MKSAMRELWSDPEFLRSIGAARANGTATSAPSANVNGAQAGAEEIAASSGTQ